MSELNGVFKLPDGQFRYELGGTPHSVDLIEAHLKLNEIAAASKDQPEFWHLQQLKEWIVGQGGPAMRLGAADALWQALRMEYVRSKKEQNEQFARLQRLPSSTASTPDE